MGLFATDVTGTLAFLGRAGDRFRRTTAPIATVRALRWSTTVARRRDRSGPRGPRAVGADGRAVMAGHGNDVRDFLIARRGRVSPEDVGLPGGGDRRVPGLRREEVAMLSGVSLDYYTRLERGNIGGASESVLGAIAATLRLTDAEREYLFDLAHAAQATRRAARPLAPDTVRSSVQRVLDTMTTPAIVHNADQDLIAANAAGRALYAPVFDTPGDPNIARFVFLDPRAREFFLDGELARRTTAAIMRLEAGRDPLNARLTALIGELSTRSPQFRTAWARQDVHEHRTGVKVFRHPVVGVVEVSFDVFELPGEPGVRIVTYSAPAGSETAEKLALLESWYAKAESEELTTRDAHDRRATPEPDDSARGR